MPHTRTEITSSAQQQEQSAVIEMINHTEELAQIDMQFIANLNVVAIKR
jgi:hypothetical protein